MEPRAGPSRSSVESSDLAAVGPKRSALLGAIGGLIGISCCVYPVALVLFGLSSAAAAVDLGNALFDEWGWAFRSAGGAFAVAAVAIQRRRARACPVGARPSFARTAIVVAAAAVATYALLYGFTTWLGILAS